MDDRYFDIALSGCRALCDERINSLGQIIDQKFEMQDKALTLSRTTMELRLEKLNELRTEVLEDRSRYVTVESYEVHYEIMDQRIKRLEMWQSRVYGIAAGAAIVGGIIGGLLDKFVF